MLNLTLKDLYLCNESHLQANLKIQVWILRSSTCFIKSYDLGKSFALSNG